MPEAHLYRIPPLPMVLLLGAAAPDNLPVEPCCGQVFKAEIKVLDSELTALARGQARLRRRAGSAPAVTAAAGVLALMPKGAEATGELELLPPVSEDIAYFFSVVLLVVLCFAALAAACLCGYACGRSQAKTEYLKELVYVEPADTTDAKTNDCTQVPLRQRKLEAGIVYFSPHGDCFHTYKGCNSLRSVSPSGLTSKRACSFCGGSPKGTQRKYA